MVYKNYILYNRFQMGIMERSFPYLRNGHSLLIMSIITLQCFVMCLRQDLTGNLLINGDFSQPSTSGTLYVSGNPGVIPGWICTNECQLDNCERSILSKTKGFYVYPNCVGQVTDINSRGTYQNISQTVNLDYGDYMVGFNYYLPFQNATQKIILVYFNDQLIFRLQPNIGGSFYGFNYQTVVTANDGSNTLIFSQDPSSQYIDGVGFRINNVSLQKITDNWLEKLLNNTIDSTISQTLHSVPGSRVVLAELMNVFVNLDRYQFYYFHARNYSRNSIIFLNGITTLMNYKGSMFSLLLQNTTFEQGLNEFILTLDYKYSYTDTAYLHKNNASFGFISNNSTQILVNLPIYIGLLIIANIGYILLRRYKVTVNLKKYTLYAIFVLMIIEGNTEQYAFYMFAEFKTFFSASIRHKMINFALVLFFYFIIVSSTVIAWFFVIHYSRKAKHLIQGRFCLSRLFTLTVQKGIFYLTFGAVHQLLLNDPNLQILVLGCIEVVLIVIKCYIFRRKLVENRVILSISMIQGVVRLLWQIQFYFYRNMDWYSADMNDEILMATIYVFIVVWGASCAFSVFKVVDKARVVIMTVVNYLDTVVSDSDAVINRNKIRCSSKRKQNLDKEEKHKYKKIRYMFYQLENGWKGAQGGDKQEKREETKQYSGQKQIKSKTITNSKTSLSQHRSQNQQSRKKVKLLFEKQPKQQFLKESKPYKRSLTISKKSGKELSIKKSSRILTEKNIEIRKQAKEEFQDKPVILMSDHKKILRVLTMELVQIKQ